MNNDLIDNAAHSIAALARELAEVRAELTALREDKADLDWLERKHGESDGEHYLVESSITYKGNTGAGPRFPATREAIRAARKETL